MNIKLEIVAMLCFPARLWCRLILFIFGINEEELKQVIKISEEADL